MNHNSSEHKHMTSTEPRNERYGPTRSSGLPSPDKHSIAFLPLPSPGGCGSSFCVHQLLHGHTGRRRLHRITAIQLPWFQQDWGVAQKQPSRLLGVNGLALAPCDRDHRRLVAKITEQRHRSRWRTIYDHRSIGSAQVSQ